MTSSRAKKYQCKILEVRWLTPSVLNVKFEPHRKFRYEPGQFVSIFVPHRDRVSKPLRRAYSFASPYEVAIQKGYELCVKYVPDGAGTGYLKSLRPGDKIEITAPYGDFVYHVPQSERNVCFICTGTGIAPFRAVALSERFRENRPEKAYCFFGARTVDEILYRGVFEKSGIETVYAVSRGSPHQDGIFQGRVTDVLRSLPNDWHWHNTDFYLCGNAEMVEEVCRILQGGHGVSEAHIFKEVFFAKQNPQGKDRRTEPSLSRTVSQFPLKPSDAKPGSNSDDERGSGSSAA